MGLLTLCMCVHGRDSSSFRRRNLKASETATAIATAVASGDTAAAAEAIATVRRDRVQMRHANIVFVAIWMHQRGADLFMERIPLTMHFDLVFEVPPL